EIAVQEYHVAWRQELPQPYAELPRFLWAMAAQLDYAWRRCGRLRVGWRLHGRRFAPSRGLPYPQSNPCRAFYTFRPHMRHHARRLMQARPAGLAEVRAAPH